MNNENRIIEVKYQTYKSSELSNSHKKNNFVGEYAKRLVRKNVTNFAQQLNILRILRDRKALKMLQEVFMTHVAWVV